MVTSFLPCSAPGAGRTAVTWLCPHSSLPTGLGDGRGPGTYSAVHVLRPLAVGSTEPSQGEAAVTPQTKGWVGGKRQVGCSRP